MEKAYVLSPDYDKPVFELSEIDIPECQVNTLMDALLRGAKTFYASPGAEEQFQEWRRMRKKEQSTNAARAIG